MSDKMREAFQDKYPLPEGVFWSDELGYYTTRSTEYILEMDVYNEFFEVWQAALTQQPESEPVGFVNAETLAALRAYQNGAAYLIWDMPIDLAQTAVYTGPQPSAQVPEATEEMLVAGLKVADPLGQLVDWDSTQNECTDRETIKSIYDAMRTAAPSPEKPTEENQND